MSAFIDVPFVNFLYFPNINVGVIFHTFFVLQCCHYDNKYWFRQTKVHFSCIKITKCSSSAAEHVYSYLPMTDMKNEQNVSKHIANMRRYHLHMFLQTFLTNSRILQTLKQTYISNNTHKSCAKCRLQQIMPKTNCSLIKFTNQIWYNKCKNFLSRFKFAVSNTWWLQKLFLQSWLFYCISITSKVDAFTGKVTFYNGVQVLANNIEFSQSLDPIYPFQGFVYTIKFREDN